MILNYEMIYCAAFKEMIEIIEKPQYNGTDKLSIVSNFLIEFTNEHNLTLSIAENIFRSLDSKVWLLGIPLHVLNRELKDTIAEKNADINLKKKKYLAILPKDDKFYDYGLWICLGRYEEIQLILDKFNITINNTDQSLENTGFLNLTDE